MLPLHGSFGFEYPGCLLSFAVKPQSNGKSQRHFPDEFSHIWVSTLLFMHNAHCSLAARLRCSAENCLCDGSKRHDILPLAQVSASVLSADEAHDPDVLSINAASAALACSGIAWAGPVGAVRIALPSTGVAPIVNATREQAAAAVLSALIVGTDQGILSVEAQVTRDWS